MTRCVYEIDYSSVYFLIFLCKHKQKVYTFFYKKPIYKQQWLVSSGVKQLLRLTLKLKQPCFSNIHNSIKQLLSNLAIHFENNKQLFRGVETNVNLFIKKCFIANLSNQVKPFWRYMYRNQNKTELNGEVDDIAPENIFLTRSCYVASPSCVLFTNK